MTRNGSWKAGASDSFPPGATSASRLPSKGRMKSSLPLVKEWLQLYSPKITFGPLKQLRDWCGPPTVKTGLTPPRKVYAQRLEPGRAQGTAGVGVVTVMLIS